MKNFLKTIFALFAIICVFGVTACSGGGGGGGSSSSSGVPSSKDKVLIGTWARDANFDSDPITTPVNGKYVAVFEENVMHSPLRDCNWGTSGGVLYFEGMEGVSFSLPYSISGNKLTIDATKAGYSFIQTPPAEEKETAVAFCDALVAETRKDGKVTYTKQ